MVSSGGDGGPRESGAGPCRPSGGRYCAGVAASVVADGSAGGAARGTLVWDLGGVVLRWEPVELVREALGRTITDFALFGHFAPGGFWEEFDRGTMGLDEVAAHMAAGAGIDVGDARRVLDAVPSHLALRADTVSLIRRTQQAGHRSVFLSNMPAPYVDRLDTLLGAVFSDGVYSCRVHQVKPGAEIFETARRLLALDPDTMLFLDDREPNVAAARASGWRAALFRDAETCAKELESAGWL
jgi:putative hydrolase of the HAD superfamily